MSVQTEKLWAMEPGRLVGLFRDMKARGLPDPEARAAMAAAATGREDRLYERLGPLAVVDMSGPLSKNGDWWWGYASMRRIAAALLEAAADPAVKGVLLDVDSPGGTVDGVEELAGIARVVAAQKPLYVYASDLMCSGAYWIGSQAREIGAQASALIGSIGVIMTHVDWSGYDEQVGIDVTYLTAGHFKALGNAHESLSDEALTYLQSQLDGVYDLFLEAVAEGRGVTREKALAMADGQIFLGRRALELGLVDRLESRADFINRITEEVRMDLQKLKAEHPGLAAEHRAEVAAEVSAGHEAALSAAVTAERERVLGVVSVLAGPELGAKLAAAAASGLTAEQARAVGAFLAPATAASGPSPSEAMLAALAGITQAPLSLAADLAAGAGDFESLVKANMDKGLSRAQAVAKAVKEHPERHAAWLAAKQPKEGR